VAELETGSLPGQSFRLVIVSVHLELVGEVGKTVHYVVRQKMAPEQGFEP
jgi:hypothetical protein